MNDDSAKFNDFSALRSNSESSWRKNVSTREIDRIVRLVLNDLKSTRSEVASTVSSSRPSTSDVSAENNVENVSKTRENSSVLRLTTKVVTLEILREKLGGISSSNPAIQKLSVPCRTVLTPSAKDELKKRSIELIFEPNNPVIEAHFEGFPNKGRVTYSNSNRTIENRRTESTASANPRTERQNLSLKTNESSDRNEFPPKTDFVIANHLSSDEKLPNSLLNWIENNTERFSTFRLACIVQTTRKLVEIFQKNPRTRGIVLTNYPSLASMLLNRQTEIRAIVGCSPEQIAAEAPSLGANILILDPKQINPFRLQQTARRFVQLGDLDLPEAFRS